MCNISQKYFLLKTCVLLVMGWHCTSVLGVTSSCFDMISHQEQRSSRVDPPIFEGDIIGVDPQMMVECFLWRNNQTSLHNNGVRDEALRWPNAKVPYRISPHYTQEQLSLIRHAMDEFHNKTCVRFVARTDETNFVYIFPGPRGCLSEIGNTGRGQQQISLATGCLSTGTILHELMHTLGFLHEHVRSDRDEYVQINLDNIESSQLNDFKSYGAELITAFNQPYDFESVLHYGANFFAKDKSRPTIQLKPPYEHMEIGQTRGLSTIDIIKVNLMYKCQPVEDVPDAQPVMTPMHPGSKNGVSDRLIVEAVRNESSKQAAPLLVNIRLENYKNMADQRYSGSYCDWHSKCDPYFHIILLATLNHKILANFTLTSSYVKNTDAIQFGSVIDTEIQLIPTKAFVNPIILPLPQDATIQLQIIAYDKDDFNKNDHIGSFHYVCVVGSPRKTETKHSGSAEFTVSFF